MIRKIINRINRAMSIEYWRIALRPIKDSDPFVYEEGSLKGFNLMSGKKYITYGDPFLLDHKGSTWLFYERQDLTDMKGSLWCRQVSLSGDEPVFHKPFKVLEEPFHLSYPQVFLRDDKLYMVPESRQDGQASLYICRDFPGVFERAATILKEPGVDTTLYFEGDTLFVYSYIDNRLKIYRAIINKDTVLENFDYTRELKTVAESDIDATLRPGGAFILLSPPRGTDPKGTDPTGTDPEPPQLIRPAQDCREYYGRALEFRKAEHLELPYISEISKINSSGAVIRLEPQMISFNNGRACPIGIHTYNRSTIFEAVDILHRECSPGVLLKKLQWKIYS